ncbi:MAG: hypothetical protein WCF20_11860 [Methylovirgula sp.]
MAFPPMCNEQWRQWAHARKPAILALWDRIKAARASGELPGCIGRSVEDCIVTLAQDLALADDYTHSHLFEPPEVDVNGKPIFPKLVEIFAFRPGVPGQPQPQTMSYRQERHPLFLRFSDADKIAEIDVPDVTNSLLRARTEADYEQTLIYEILRPLTRASCPQFAKLELDRFIENKLKPPVRNVAALGAAAKARFNVKSSPLLPFCGRKLKLEVTTERPRYHPHDLRINSLFVIR